MENEYVECRNINLYYGLEEGKEINNTFAVNNNKLNSILVSIMDVMEIYSIPSWGFKLSSPYKIAKEDLLNKKQITDSLTYDIEQLVNSDIVLVLNKD